MKSEKTELVTVREAPFPSIRSVKHRLPALRERKVESEIITDLKPEAREHRPD